MNRRSLVAALLVLPASPAILWADPVRLTADEIDGLLRGRRIKGDWNGTAYQQKFDESGHTLYIPDGGTSDPGRWRVNANENSYESWWERSGWSSYAIERDGEALYWVDSAGKRYPFEVLE